MMLFDKFSSSPLYRTNYHVSLALAVAHFNSSESNVFQLDRGATILTELLVTYTHILLLNTPIFRSA